jgi:hypothetical protein
VIKNHRSVSVSFVMFEVIKDQLIRKEKRTSLESILRNDLSPESIINVYLLFVCI